jgi:CheY-like chemotaxis protein
MSHEIRTPLNGVLAMAQIMAMGEMTEQQRERLDVIRKSGESLLAVLNDILDLSKIEAGRMELEPAPFETASTIRQAFAGFTAMAEKKGLDYAIEIDPMAEGWRQGDAARVCQIVNNLISNAIKFTEKGKVALRVEAEGPDGAAGVRLLVSDTGMGIAPRVGGDGRAAVAAWESEAWDVVLMDIQMPEMDGVDATAAIRARERATGRPRTPILALTANAMSHQVEAYLAAGMDGHVAKPIAAAALFTALSAAVADDETAPAQRLAG